MTDRIIKRIEEIYPRALCLEPNYSRANAMAGFEFMGGADGAIDARWRDMSRFCVALPVMAGWNTSRQEFVADFVPRLLCRAHARGTCTCKFVLEFVRVEKQTVTLLPDSVCLMATPTTAAAAPRVVLPTSLSVPRGVVQRSASIEMDRCTAALRTLLDGFPWTTRLSCDARVSPMESLHAMCENAQRAWHAPAGHSYRERPDEKNDKDPQNPSKIGDHEFRTIPSVSDRDVTLRDLVWDVYRPPYGVCEELLCLASASASRTSGVKLDIGGFEWLAAQWSRIQPGRVDPDLLAQVARHTEATASGSSDSLQLRLERLALLLHITQNEKWAVEGRASGTKVPQIAETFSTVDEVYSHVCDAYQSDRALMSVLGTEQTRTNVTGDTANILDTATKAVNAMYPVVGHGMLMRMCVAPSGSQAAAAAAILNGMFHPGTVPVLQFELRAVFRRIEGRD